MRSSPPWHRGRLCLDFDGGAVRRSRRGKLLAGAGRWPACGGTDARPCGQMRWRGGVGDGVCTATHRSWMAKENSATGTAWAAEAQIACDGFANVAWQRHLGHASTFAMDGDPTVVPIDIIQFQ